MEAYRYHAYTHAGRVSKGIIEAASEKEAREKLRTQGLMVAKLGANKTSSRLKDLKGARLVQFIQQLGQLLHAKLPLYQSLALLEEQHRNTPYHHLYLSLCRQIQQGFSFASALKQHPKSFDGVCIHLISAGEVSGTLPAAMQYLSKLLDTRLKLKKQIVTAFLYPTLVMFFSFTAMLALLLFAVPSIQGLIEGRTVSPMTSFVFALSGHMGAWGLLEAAILGALALAGMRWLMTPRGKILLDKAGLTLPLIKNAYLALSLARFSKTLAALLQGGIPLVPALQSAKEVIGSPLLHQAIGEIVERIIEGESLSKQLKMCSLFPPLFVHMVAVGEDSGDMASTLHQSAQIYEDELEKWIARFSVLLPPVVLILTGCLVGLVMLAVLLPLTDITSVMDR